MKKLQITAWILFCLGVGLLFLHYFGGTILMLLACVLLVVHSVLYFLKHPKTKVALLNISMMLITVFLLSKIKYWSWSKPVFFAACLSSAISLTISNKNQSKLQWTYILLLFSLGFSSIVYFTPPYQIYYVEHLNTFINSDSRKSDYLSWDKYSWFLYSAGKFEEATQAIVEAQKAVEECLKIDPNEEAAQYQFAIKQHAQQISNRTWENYR